MKALVSRWLAVPLVLRWVVLFWVVLLVAIFIRVAVSKPTQNSVVPVYLLGGNRWLNSEDLYTPSPGGLDVFRFPPLSAAFFAPLTFLPEKVAALLWRSLCVLAYVTSLRRVQQSLFPTWNVYDLALYWFLSGLLAIPALDNGQMNLAILAGVLHGFASLAAQRAWFAALAFTIPITLKVYPVAALGLALMIAPRLLGLRAFVCLSVAFGGVYLLQEPSYVTAQYRGFVAAMKEDDRTETAISRAPKDWTVLSRLYLGQTILRPVPVIVAATAGVALALVLAFKKYERRDSQIELLTFAMLASLLWMTLFGPATEPNTYILLAPVSAILCLSRIGFARGMAWIGTATLVVCILSGLFPTGAAFLNQGPHAIAGLCLLIAHLWSKPK